MSSEKWWDEFGGETANLNRLLVGKKLSFGDHERGQEEREVEIAYVDGVVVGIDSDGIFAGIEVETTDGDDLVLYTNGAVCDPESDETLGRHDLRWRPKPKAVAS